MRASSAILVRVSLIPGRLCDQTSARAMIRLLGKLPEVWVSGFCVGVRVLHRRPHRKRHPGQDRPGRNGPERRRLRRAGLAGGAIAGGFRLGAGLVESGEE